MLIIIFKFTLKRRLYLYIFVCLYIHVYIYICGLFKDPGKSSHYIAYNGTITQVGNVSITIHRGAFA